MHTRKVRVSCIHHSFIITDLASTAEKNAADAKEAADKKAAGKPAAEHHNRIFHLTHSAAHDASGQVPHKEEPGAVKDEQCGAEHRALEPAKTLAAPNYTKPTGQPRNSALSLDVASTPR